MTISKGDTLPNATVLRMGNDGPEQVQMDSLTKGRKVAIFGLPGAYTGTCSTAHVPSFIRNMEGFKSKGVDEVICVSVNDPFVMDAWSDSTGAKEAGITMLGDAAAEFTKAIGMNWTAEGAGFYDRSRRYALYAEDGVVKSIDAEDSPGTCDVSSGEALLEQI
ncbi:peroxiredoxin [Gymnodinialimonas ceratoperidinii]|uniref:Glutathione-dependent peroxiredoxin n=1 Tax=Gymnodinialimonas ceratoperidinii TaxID=2856823 RepID=A0A8F6YB74_9RHOB|nr:peroxiredoxin [Gymnodinialimonas ceratoperidinii]QXT39786.1 peroxiredoxin [Gymnodinialimonas ceratoperidinii]